MRSDRLRDPRELVRVNTLEYRGFPRAVVLQMVLELGINVDSIDAEERWSRYHRYMIRRGWL